MGIKSRYQQYKLIKDGVTLTDKVKLLVLAFFFTFPNKWTNMNAQTPNTLIKLCKNLKVNHNGTIVVYF
jgi:hypothetical protein